MGLFFLAGAVHDPGRAGRRSNGALVLLAAAIGVGIAAYHLWVQHLPPDPMAGCTPGWNYMVETFPISKALKMAFTGHADCAEVNWTFLGLSMPFWTLVCFAMIGAGAAWSGFKRRP
jgi:disulfide bond formation protein DsbB